MQRTIRIHLQPSPAQAEALAETCRQFTTFRWRTDESNDFLPYSHHGYAYALSNPINLSDPTGRCIPGLDPNCDWREIRLPECISSWVPIIGQSDCESLGNVDDFRETLIDPIVQTVKPTYDVITNQPGAREQVRQGWEYTKQHPEAFAGEVGRGLIAPYQSVYNGIVCQDSKQLGQGLVGFELQLAMARLTRGQSAVPETTLSVIQRLARQADQTTTIPPGTNASVAGTLIHSTLTRLVRGLNRADLTTEVNYLNGRPVFGNIRGSVRLDIVEGPLNNPIAVYDLKTGAAGLTAQRIAQIRSHLPNNGILPNGQPVPVIEIRP